MLDDRLAADLSSAIVEGGIQTYFQPQVDLRSGQVVAIEALSRWRHPRLGAISPAVFVPLAEASGSIHDLGLHALRDCCRYGATWQEGGMELQVALNVSPLQLARASFVDELTRELDEAALAPGNLILEITEAEQIDEPARSVAHLDAARSLGVTVSIDDFGTKHSSAERALMLQAAELKIDRSLVVASEPGLLEDALRFARDHDMRTVAEGIQSPEQFDRVTRLGCDRAQGFLIAEPASPMQFERWMRSRGYKSRVSTS